MIVPNYVPDPIEIPGNVTEEPYDVRVAFTKRVMALHALSVALVSAAACIPHAASPTALGAGIGALMVALSFVRIAARGARAEWIASAALLLPLLLLLGLLSGALARAGLPVWAPAAGAGAAFLYTLFCGRDYSFMGQWVLALVGSSAAVAAIHSRLGGGPAVVAAALALNAAYVTYLVYDLASLLSRRRLGEELGAVADLYRDVLNFTTYLFRVVGHWRRHRIWSPR